MTMDISVLPAEVLSKIASYCIGKPEDIRLKHSKGLKQIQKRYRQIYRGLERTVGFCDDDECMYEFYVYKLKSNNKGMSRIDDIPKEVGYIKSKINNSHIRHIQPDMHCDVHIRIDCEAKIDEADSPTDFTFDTSDVCFFNLILKKTVSLMSNIQLKICTLRLRESLDILLAQERMM